MGVADPHARYSSVEANAAALWEAELEAVAGVAEVDELEGEILTGSRCRAVAEGIYSGAQCEELSADGYSSPLPQCHMSIIRTPVRAVKTFNRQRDPTQRACKSPNKRPPHLS